MNCSGTDGVGFSVSSGDVAKKVVTVETGAVVTGDFQMGNGNDQITNLGEIDGNVAFLGAEMNAIDRLINIGTVGAVSGTSGRQELQNRGTVEGAVSFGDGDDLVINEGQIVGAIDLGDATNDFAGDYLNSTYGSIGSDGTDGFASTLGTEVVIGGSGIQRITLGGTTHGNVNAGSGNDSVGLIAGAFVDGDVDLGMGDDSFEIQSDSAVLSGDLAGGGGYDILEFGGGAGGSPTAVVGSINNAWANLPTLSTMEALEVDAGGVWQITSNLVTGLDTVVTNGTLEVALGATLTGQNVTVAEDATLAGAGTVLFASSQATPATNAGTISVSQLQGDAGATVFSNTGTVAVGSTVDLGDGSDTLLETGNIEGTISLGLGSDTHTQTSTPAFTGILTGGAGDDSLVLDTVDGGTIDSANFVSFENLSQNTGSWTLTGTQTYSTDIVVAGGALTSGSAAHVTMGSGSNITGNIVTSGSGGQTIAFDNATYTGAADLGAGDDQFIINGASTLTGALDGGAGTGDVLTLQGSGTLAVPVLNVETANAEGGDWVIGSGSSYTFTNGTNVVSGSLTNNGALVTNVNVAEGTTFAGSGSIDGDLTINGTYAGTMALSPGAATANTVTLNSTGVMAAGSTVALGAGSDSFTHLGALYGSVDYGAGADIHTYYGSDPAMLAGAMISGGSDTDQDRLVLAGNRDGSPFTGAQRDLDPTQFPNWDRLEVGGGAWGLDGPATFTDGVAVSGGLLDVDDVLTLPPGQQLEVGVEGTLSGDGTIVGNVVSDGTIMPGAEDDLGTLTIDGNLDLGPTSNVIIDMTGTPPASDLLVVTGSTDLDGTMTLSPLNAIPPGMVIPFLSLNGPVTGEFTELVSEDPSISVTLDTTDPNNPEIQIGTLFGIAATEQNIWNVGDYLGEVAIELSNDSMSGNELQQKLLDTSGEAHRAILAQVSPDLYDQNTSALFERNRHFQAAMLAHVARCDTQRRFVEEYVSSCNSRRRQSASKANVWSSISGFSMDREGENKYLDYQVNGGAAQFGVDGQLFPGLIVGASFAAGRTTFANDYRGSGTTSDYDVGAYSQLNLVQGRSLTVDVGVATSLGFGSNRAERNLDAVQETYEATFDTTRQSLGVVLGMGSEHRGISFGGKLTSNLSAVQRGEIVESGNGNLNFIIEEADYAQLDVGIKGDVGYRMRMSDDFYFIPKVSLGVTQLVAGDRRELDAKLKLAEANEAILTVESYDLPTTYNSDLTLELQSKAGMLAYAQAGADVSGSSFSRRFEGGIRLEF